MSENATVDPLDDFESKLADPLSPVLLGGIGSGKVVRLFSLFSRFEHAMKCHNYAAQDRFGNIQPDWSGFCVRMAGAFNQSKSQRLNDSISYLLANPPMKQRIDLSWEPCQFPAWCADDSSKAIWLAKNVRNNLFHGGKYLDVMRQRDEMLIDAACVIILASLSVDKTLANCFEAPPRIVQ
ncbi:hypothetical protein [Serratia marcescens]|uniref:hypothetical protein n=1 Tax=Serratia marcescens TaxID=615 RepID=UPI0012B58EC5|nr:hypothetical protein [Serratia marcescens]